MNKLFSSSGYHAFDVLALESGGVLDFRQLSPFLRVLLTTDGTVTKILESYFWEPVDVQCRNQGLALATQEHLSLDLNVGDELLEREVLLVGKQSGQIYAKAHSFVCLSRLPLEVRDALLDKRMGIGELVRESGLETYRELISIDRSIDELLDECVDRSYRILALSRPIILIKEYFPLSMYSEG